MTYHPHYLLAFGGHTGHAQEQWACGIRIMGYGDASEVQMDDAPGYLIDIGLPALITWFQTPLTRIHSNAHLQWAKFNYIGADGKYVNQGTTNEVATNTAGGGGTTNAHPLQVCYCTSFRTDALSRGKGSMGRIYVPRPVIAVDSNGDIGVDDRVAAATTMATLLNTLDFSDTEIGVGAFWRPSIVSRGTAPNFIDEGPFNQIDYVIVDSALDIQRRRAMQQSREGHARVSVPY